MKGEHKTEAFLKVNPNGKVKKFPLSIVIIFFIFT